MYEVNTETVDGVYVGRIDEDWAVAYGLATNDPNELYTRGVAVPPVFTATLILPALQESARTGLERAGLPERTAGVHGEHDILYRGTVRPGMTVQWSAGLHGVRQTKGGVLSVSRIVISDLEGTPLVEHYWSNFYPGAAVTEEIGEAPLDHTFPDAARAHPVGSRTIEIALDQTYRYAGVSGDHAPHAMDDERARSEGHPSKILQGMCTFGLCGGAVVDAVAGGDPRRLRRLAGRFSAPVFPKRDLTVTLYDAGSTDEGTRAIAFEAVQEGVTVIKHGRVELLPD